MAMIQYLTDTSGRNRFHPGLCWLFLGTCLAILPHLLRIPVWITLLFLLLTGWKLLRSDNNGNLPYQSSALMKLGQLLAAMGMIAGILITYGTLTGRDAGVALLILLAALKFLEIQDSRDYYVTSFLGLFLILTCFLYNQSIPTALYMLFVVSIFITTLITCNDKNRILDIRTRFTTAGSMLLQSLPFMLLIFVLFPRIQGPLWGLPRDAHGGLSGLSDEMSPGAISQLALSDEIAFRVKFDGSIPARSVLYWRGPVLTTTDGFTWVQDRPRYPGQPVITPAGRPVSYTVTQEPMDNNWLFALEMAPAAPEGGVLTHTMQLRTRSPVQGRKQFSLTSYTSYSMQAGSEEELEQALQLPYGYHQQAVALGASWQNRGLPDQEIISTALRLFNDQDFYYSLTPPLLNYDIVDEFLFATRQGFCEHYAAAFVVLMRAAGIPARVVTGYQGGNINPLDNYLVIRHRDAHAWTEVWLDERGWIRIDPTSVVSPARINAGIENALPDSIIDVPSVLRNSGVVRGIWRRIRNTIDAIDNRWNQWVLSYDAKRQQRLFRQIGMGELNWQGMLVSLAVFSCILLLILATVLFRQGTPAQDQARMLYDRFCNRLARSGIRRRASEGPEEFACRAVQARRDLSDPIKAITALYISARYANRTEAINLLEQQVRAFRPSRTPP
jgi:transglutaminase-like putative cysteine protease